MPQPALESSVDGLSWLRMDVWSIGPSAIAGNGVIARKPLPANFEVFREGALVLGPRAGPRCLIVCVGCHQTGLLRMCPKECGLPVCDECVGHPECEIFSKISGLGVRDKLSLVAPLRAVFLNPDERKKLKQLERHDRSGHKTLLTQIEKHFTEEDREIIQICCQVLDATAFETPTKGAASIRGIYPTAGMMNHSCTPNTRHSFNSAGQMVVNTTRSITENEELTTHYCPLVWGTQARVAHLKATKCFTCRCCRCLDPTEFGSQLMGLYCMKKNCGGVLIPTAETTGMWSCGRCLIQVPELRVSVIQKMIAGVISGLEAGNLATASRMLCKDALVPSCNYLAVGLKINLVFVYGNRVGFGWSELRNMDLVLKKLLCVELLLLFSLLRLGLSRQRGLVLRELAATMRELERREKSAEVEGFLQKIPNYGSINDIEEEANSILKNDTC